MNEHAALRSDSALPPIALTMGDPAGVGCEITLKCWHTHRATLPCFFLIADPDHLGALARHLAIDIPIRAIKTPADATDTFATALPVLPLALPTPPQSGIADERNAVAVIKAIEQAVSFVRHGDASAIVTNPIHKQSLYGAGFDFPGHTEFLAHLAGISTRPVMMLACPAIEPPLRVVPVTIHVSLQDAVQTLTTNAIVECAHITAKALQDNFAIAKPRLAIAGLNPHAGEGGAMGDEEARVIQPAIEQLRTDGIDVSGPAPSDTLFSPRARQTYDAAICMYHDQALIPVKTLDFDRGVNITLGLPFVRTSPDHGTAFDIAGTGKASAESLRIALTTAFDMARASNRA